MPKHDRPSKYSRPRSRSGGAVPKRTSPRRRALGQHFLSNRHAARRLIEIFDPVPGEHVLEIGPGGGALTGPLLEAGARVTAIELDRGLAEALARRHADNPGFRLVQADVLRCDLADLAGPSARVLANLPYAITGEVLYQLLMAGPPITAMLLMLQREVVNRITASPVGRTYGSLSVLAQYFTDPVSRMTLSPGSFSPPPAVSSSVVWMPFRAARELPREAERGYAAFVRALFGHRRQTLWNNLRAMPGHGDQDRLAARLRAAGIDPRRRPETLSRDECLLLYGSLAG
jgi:16S rRNA (adenine1518-N6/adenine1519-N6)-dimethyltransferase